MIVVQCHGTFDLFHYGHLCYLQAAREFGDILIVTVTADKYVRKGEGRPVFKEHQRVAMLRALAIVDDVKVINAAGAEPAIREVRPHVYVKGIEYIGKLPEQKLVEQLGGRVEFTFHDEGSFIKSTNLLRYYTNDKQPLRND